MYSIYRRRLGVLLVLASALLLLLLPAAAMSSGHENGSQARTVEDIQFLGETIIETGATHGGTEIGGLSSITYDQQR